MNLTIIGTGYVGLTSGAMFAELGHRVTCVDTDQKKLTMLRSGRVPFFEPGLDKLVKKHLGGNLRFAPDLASAARTRAVMLAVGTPPAPDGSPDIKYVLEAAGQLAPYLKKYRVIIIKSTVPVGTKKMLQQHLLNLGIKQKHFSIVSNPEFLREGSALADSFNPDRIVIGADSQKALEITRALYQKIECPVMITTNEAAEMIKYAANAFLATKISFINELADICEEYNIDIDEVARGIGYDARIGRHFLKAGAGYGGSCLPKDISALRHLAESAAKQAALLQAVNDINNRRPTAIIEKLEKQLGSLEGKKVAVWGLSFKPQTDDMRFSPAIAVIGMLLEKKAEVVAFDPVAMDKAREVLAAKVLLAGDMYAAANGCDALIIMTEWQAFAGADLGLLKRAMKQPVIVDGRNVFSPTEARKNGFHYQGMGRQ